MVNKTIIKPLVITVSNGGDSGESSFLMSKMKGDN